jgi:hypothetical protein
MAQIKLSSRLKKIEQDLDKIKVEFLTSMANDIVDYSLSVGDKPNDNLKPAVDTGAYITSHSIRSTRGAGRSRTSHGKPRKQDPEVKGAEARAMLMEDIASLPKDAPDVYLSNNSPHANIVEFAEGHGYNIYGIVRNRAKLNLQDAINKVRGTQ